MWREVPIGAPTEGAVLEGFIDLLFEGPDGLEVVDYKTDDVSGSEYAESMPAFSRRFPTGSYP